MDEAERSSPPVGDSGDHGFVAGEKHVKEQGCPGRKEPISKKADDLDVIVSMLEDAELDSDYWIQEFQEKFGMKKVKQFRFLCKGKRQTVQLLDCARYEWEKDALEEFVEALGKYFNVSPQQDLVKQTTEPDNADHAENEILKIEIHPNFLLTNHVLNIGSSEKLINNDFTVLPVSSCSPTDNLFQIKYLDQLQCYDNMKYLLGVENAFRLLDEISDSENNVVKLGISNHSGGLTGIASYITIPTVEVDMQKHVMKLSSMATTHLQKLDLIVESSKKDAKEMAQDFIKTFGSHFITGKLIFGSLTELVIIAKQKEKDSPLFRKLCGEMLKSVDSIKHLGTADGQWISATEVLDHLSCEKFKQEDTSVFKVRLTKTNSALLKIVEATTHKVLDLYEFVHPIWSLIRQEWHQFKHCELLEDIIATEWKRSWNGESPSAHINNEQDESDSLSLHEILGFLGLTECYPNTITLNDVMKITEVEHREEVTDLPWVVLQKLIMMDHNVVETDVSVDKHKSVHPLDLLALLYECCDPMLQQLLAKKLYLCRIAIPFILPFEKNLKCNLWPLENITMEYRNHEDKACEEPLTRHEVHIVSVLRYGRPKISKSKFLNEVLCDKPHGVFYHCDKPGGMNKRQISEGLVEMSHFLPSGKSNDIFQRELLFMNLRGDGYKCRIQTECLLEMSSVVLFIVEFDDVEEFCTFICDCLLMKHPVSLVVMITCNGTPTDDTMCRNRFPKVLQENISIVTDFHPMLHRPKSCYEMKKDIRTVLAHELQCSKRCHCLQDLSQVFEKKALKIDEQIYEGCLEGQTIAKQLSEFVKSTDITACKANLVPLQGDLWHNWAKLQKQKYRLRGGGDRDDLLKKKEEIQMEMNKLRGRQCVNSENVSPFLQKFFEFLLHNVEHRNTMFCLHWLKQELDDFSRIVLPSLQLEYKQQWEMYKSVKNNYSESQNDTVENKLNKIERDIFNAAFGIEHILREMSQLYESSMENKDMVSKWQFLPELAASLLLNGVPLEIMDGDAASVPLDWVKAVLQVLKEKLNNKRVFVLSVIGIQSSGKSTLLNTMFGLEFAVSAGRCTRGIFAQLLPTAVESKLPFEYLMLLDSEGLRAPELANEKFQHDNELATFVIGLADLTLVNLKGENTAEMRDVLQISVHAFLRMKLADKTKRQRCIFVHQNVAALNAREKMMFGQKKLQESLDQMTREAAQAEDANSSILSFNDVIEFDGQQHVWYFSDLWSGDPPMAPVNTGYSSKAIELRNAILHRLVDMQPDCVTFENLTIRLEDMWKAVLSDDFVFSFRNSLAIKAHISLEQICSQLQHGTDSQIAKWRKMNLPQISKCSDIETLDAIANKVRRDFDEMMHKRRDFVENELRMFFDKSEFKDILDASKELTISSIHLDIKSESKSILQELDVLKEERFAILQQTDRIHHRQDDLITAAISLAKALKGQAHSEEEIDREFESLWRSQVNVDTGNKEQKERKTIMHEIQSVLYEYFQASKSKYIMDEMQSYQDYETFFAHRSSLTGSVSEITKDVYEFVTWGEIMKRTLGIVSLREFEVKIVQVINDIYAKMEDYLNDSTSQDMKFQRIHAKEFINTLYQQFYFYNSNQAQETHIRLRYRGMVKYCVFAAPYAAKCFEEMNRRYEAKHGYAAEMEAQKRQIKKLFVNTIQLATDNSNTANLLGDVIRNELEDVIDSRVSLQITDDIMQHFSHTKFHLMIEILEDLCKSFNYERYNSYIFDAYSFTRAWLLNFTNKFSFTIESEGIHRYGKLSRVHIENLFAKIKDAMEEAFSITNHTPNEDRLNTLIETFCEVISPTLSITVSDMATVMSQSVNDYTNLKEMIFFELDEVHKFVQNKYDNINEVNVDWGDNNPHLSTLKKLWGCKEQCPFCKEPCMKTNPLHVEPHQCLQHRPLGVRGGHWEENKKLVIENCTFAICSGIQFKCPAPFCKCGQLQYDEHLYHEYRDYKKYHPNWDIAPDNAGEASEYWKWVLWSFNGSIAMTKHLVRGDIPASWYNVKQKDAMESLRKYAN